MVAFLSMSCKHCALAADKLAAMHHDNSFPLLVVLNGDSTKAPDYIEAHQLTGIPYTMLYEPHFSNLAGNKLPSIYLISDHHIVKRITHRDLSPNRLNNWF